MRKLPVGLFCRNPTALPLPPNQRQIRRVPPSPRGALRDRHERWVRDAVDALAAQDERCPDADSKIVWSAPRRWCQVSRKFSRGDGGYQARHTGESTIYAVNTIVRGKLGELAEPVVTTLVCFVLFRTRGCGCGHAPGFPRALCFRGWSIQRLGRMARRECRCMSWSSYSAKGGVSSTPRLLSQKYRSLEYWITRFRG